MKEELGLSERRACRLVGIHRSVARYEPRKQSSPDLLDRLRELASKRRRYGYRRLTVLLRREGFQVNHKKVYRMYRKEEYLLSLSFCRRRPAQMVSMHAYYHTNDPPLPRFDMGNAG